MKKIAAIILVITAATLIACGAGQPRMINMPSPQGPRVAGALRVGVSRVDVTPPPGLSSFGHAPDAHVTRGYWTRLHCRVFVLQTSAEDRVALVPCDLAAISALLHQKVLEDLRALDVTFPPSRVMIAATHTHAGPAHYFESYAYGGITSSHLPGFDPAMVEFLASRIAQGIATAASAMRPAVARWQHAEEWGLTRNRSVVPFQANGTAPVYLTAPPSGVRDEDKAIDPRLDILELEDATPGGLPLAPLGWLVFFAMHPTVLPATNRLLGGDTHAAASRMLESEMRRIGKERHDACVNAGGAAAHCAVTIDPLAGIFNTNEGDISPKWAVGDTEEVLAIARDFSERVVAKYDSLPVSPGTPAGFASQMTIDARYIQRYLPGATLRNKSGHLCKKPELGNATGHGGSDHRASFDYLVDTGPDVDDARRDCQSPKAPLLGQMQSLLLGREASRYPTDVAFGLVRLDDVYLSFMPAELTVHAGALVNGAVLAKVGGGAKARVVGLSNSYIQYVTTDAEYKLQYYEGGSTLYGPRSAEYMADQAAILAEAMSGTSAAEVDVVRTIAPETAPVRERLALMRTPASEIPERKAEGLCRLSGPTFALCFWWTDASAGSVPLAQDPKKNEPWIELITAAGGPVYSCEPWGALAAGRAALCDPGASIDDRGVDFFTTVRESAGAHERYRWTTVFRPSPVEWIGLSGPVRLRARATAGASPVDSAPFSPSMIPALCSARETRQCVVVE